MSTSTPAVYNGRAYIGVSGTSQFGAYSGHSITVVDLSAHQIAYRTETMGYPQTSGILTTAYEEDSGYVYVYFIDNYTPGKLRVLRDKAGQTKADYVTKEFGMDTPYVLFTPSGDGGAVCHLHTGRGFLWCDVLQKRYGTHDGLWPVCRAGDRPAADQNTVHSRRSI